MKRKRNLLKRQLKNQNERSSQFKVWQKKLGSKMDQTLEKSLCLDVEKSFSSCLNELQMQTK